MLFIIRKTPCYHKISLELYSYIMRIHGTFVNFLDLSPAIQEDIIASLDADETVA